MLYLVFNRHFTLILHHISGKPLTLIPRTLFVLDTGDQMYAWKHPVIIAFLCTAVVAVLTFGLFEKCYAREPIFPIQLLTRYEVVTSYAILTVHNLSPTAVSFPLIDLLHRSVLRHL
jgi:hypothetical protein